MNSPLTHFSSPAQSQTQRVPGDIFLKFSSTMKLLCCFIISVLYILPALSSKCSDKQYSWPFEIDKLCCDKCPPGFYVLTRSQTNCKRTCTPCEENKFIDSYNTAMYCSSCKGCNKPNMEVKTRCNATHNAVCTCEAGYTCKSHDCNECVVTTTTTKPTVPPSTTVARPGPGAVTTHLPPKRIGDTAWFLVIIALLCIGIALVFVTKIKTFLLWIKSKHGYFLAENAALQPPFHRLEVVSKPVQEMCGKCETCV